MRACQFCSADVPKIHGPAVCDTCTLRNTRRRMNAYNEANRRAKSNHHYDQCACGATKQTSSKTCKPCGRAKRWSPLPNTGGPLCRSECAERGKPHAHCQGMPAADGSEHEDCGWVIAVGETHCPGCMSDLKRRELKAAGALSWQVDRYRLHNPAA